ncbi:T9SS type A sorting domain-containing protein [Flavobacterium sp. GT3R68]|uniref:T9SS type A sorting domain-containing protein n=1 Tax=Flavobacterium sp. GT3R68 TaxID=2594437 RepID=UPI000F896D88|nr:T9SS type A sorting domain-containing protein [Flavobacterium sp. GT3R68]RTY95084.1 T9SS type A sorting domain-containing protein [Flavobacterium sp. GSN2]TRW91890.1 T9SS type A sorting domain-containing protein [Flavobacterium sp. GT3R68]
MKKITLILFAFFLSMQINAQLFQVTTCSGGIATNAYGPMNSIATANATSRTAVIYPSSQLVGLAGQTLTAAYFNRIAATGALAGTPTFKVYLKETGSSDFGLAALDWATEIATATLVYNSDPTASVGSSAGWKSFSFSTNFLYTGTQNLEVLMEYSNTTALTTAVTWDYEYGNTCISTTNNNTTKYSNNTTGTPAASLASSNYRRPQIGFDFLVSCPAPTGFSTNSLTAFNVNLNWNVGGSETMWEYAILPSANPAPTSGTAIGTNSVVGAAVSPATSYTAYVRANCGPGDNSVWKTINFTSLCDVYTVPFAQDFTTYVPACWQEADNGDALAGPATFGSSTWIVDGFANAGTTGAVRYNVYTTGANDWIMSPVISIPATGYELKFDAAATQYATANSPTTPWESDDSIEVLVSNGTSNWTVLYTYNDTNVPSNAGSTNIIDLDAYSGQNVRFAFRAIEGATNGAADIDFSIDNFELRLTPACSNPIGLVTANVTSASADVSWSPVTGSVNYEYVLDTVAANPAGSGTSIMATTYNATLLSPLTTYYFHVRNNCGAIFSAWSTVSFTTPATPPSNDTCASAIIVTPGGDFATNAVTGTVVGATTATGLTYACQTNRFADVWYSVVVPASGTLTIETQANGASLLTDTVVSVFAGACGSLTEVGCDDDLGTGNFSLVNLTSQTPGSTLYIGVWKYGTVTNDTFRLSAYDASLETTSFDNTNFSYYPNPVKDVLNLSYTTQISTVSVFNLLGQEVMTKAINASQSQIDMSHLSTGTYVVQVTADDQVKMIKVIKE